MKRFFLIACIVTVWHLTVTTCSENKPETPSPVLHDPLQTCHDEEEACARDKVAFNAISELHAQLDEDKDGEVDPSEADEFARDELKYTDSFERTNALHKHDKHISKLELWNAWKHSEVYNWTAEMVEYWLIHEVQLPQYAECFKKAQVAGPDVPKLAVSNMKFLSNTLNIKNSVHKQKIILKAIDLILFGPPKSSHNPWKDLSVVITILLLAGGCWYAMVQNRYSRRHIARMNIKLEQLIKAEQSLRELPSKLDESCPDHADGQHTEECRSRKEMTREVERIQDERVQANEDGERLRLAEEELEFRRDLELDLESEIALLKRQIGQLQGQLATMPSGGGGVPGYVLPELQLLLQLCCESERQHLHAKKAAVTSTLNAVKEEHMKLTKKKSGFIGAIRLDVSGNMDHIESKISSAKDAVYDVKRSYTEHQNRWAQVERILHLSILNNPGIKTVQATLSDLKSSTSSANLLHSVCIPQTKPYRNSISSRGGNSGFGSNASSAAFSSAPNAAVSRPLSLVSNSASFSISPVMENSGTYPGFSLLNHPESSSEYCTSRSHCNSPNSEVAPSSCDEMTATSIPSLRSVRGNSLSRPSSHSALLQSESATSTSTTANVPCDAQQRSENHRSVISFIRPFAYRWKKKASSIEYKNN